MARAPAFGFPAPVTAVAKDAETGTRAAGVILTDLGLKSPRASLIRCLAVGRA